MDNVKEQQEKASAYGFRLVDRGESTILRFELHDIKGHGLVYLSNMLVQIEGWLDCMSHVKG